MLTFNCFAPARGSTIGDLWFQSCLLMPDWFSTWLQRPKYH